MKRTTLFLFVFLMAIMSWADNVTVQQALQQAQSFVRQREDAGSRPKRVKGSAASQLTMVKQVSGLYLFNVGDNGGFVVVSNDDSTVPILGFSDSGAIDPDNMPDNMRAWLQGYADEIAWAREHDVAKATKATKAGAAQASRRVGSHSTAAIAPLVASKWNQDTPFNDLCPEYTSGKKSATGCVATAMAQVMYYHKWPQDATEVIPSYYWGRLGYYLPELPSITFDWANMLDEYPFHWEKSGSVYVKVSDCTDAQATAVATLMKYCGYSVKMSYGPESGSNTDLVASALKAYFDYKTSTVQAVSRSYYSYANWTDLIYHELANGRPVVYGGQSSGGGHEFVCDGYKYESSMDFFHINWGWGGTSDNYFVLSALDPDEQGIGGSSSTDGFHYGQDAVIGIQPSTGTGTTADITPVVINLKANSITPSSNPATCYVPMNITVNVTNNSADDYDGDISIGLYDGGWYVVAGTNCFIPSGTTKDVVVSYLPTEAGNYTIMPFDGSSYSIGSSTTFTVSAAQKNTRVPIFGDNCDEYSKSQIIIPAANLEEMAYGTLNSVTFYASTLSAISWGSAQFDVYLKEVPETSFASATLYDWSTMEKVYSGSLSVGSDGRMVITFSNPFVYEGGNLLVGINQTQSGNYYGLYWVGSSASSASLGGYNTSIAKQDFLPLTTFDYTPGEAPGVPRPKNVIVNYTGGRTAEVSWTSTESAFDIDVNGTVTENVTNPYTLTNLEFATTYTVKVRAKNGSDVSNWSSPATFTTELSDEMCQIRFELTDSYGDGWNGAAIQVIDLLTGIEIGTVTNTNAAAADEAQTYLLDVPNKRDIRFVWQSGNYDSECSYVAYDINGELIFSGSGALSTVTYHVSCSFVPKPTNVTVTPASTSATVTWTGSGDSYNLRYRAIKSLSYDFESAEPWVVDDFAPFTTYDGDGLNTYNISGSSFTNQQYTGSVIAFQNGIAGNFTAHSGNAFGCFMDAIPDGDKTNNNDWFITPEIQITEGMVFSFWARSVNNTYGLERFKVGVYGNANGTFASYLEGSATEYAEAPVEWTQYTYDLSAYVGQTIKLAINCVSADAFAFCIDDIFIGVPGSDSWNGPISNVTTPYVLKGLAPETPYEVQVQAETAGETSAWTVPVLFTTTAAAFVLGDANGDGSVTISDAVAIVNKILGNPSGSFNAAAANVSGDVDEHGAPIISITDAVGVVNIILNSGSSAPQMDMKELKPETDPE